MYSVEDAARLRGCLEQLLPYLNRSSLALTGGVAIARHLAACGQGTARALADLDFVATNLSAISADVTSDFLVSHFHLPHPGYPKFMLQVVDPVHRLKVDFFPDLMASVQRAEEHTIGGTVLKVLTAEDIFEHELTMVRKASAEQPLEEKYYQHARWLGRLCGQNVPQVPAEWLCEREVSRDANYRCERCVASEQPTYPLAPKQAIVDILGYV